MSKIFFILKKELRETFRDKKSLAMMLVVPLMIPLIIVMMSFIFNSSVDKDIKTYNKIGFAYSLSNEEKELTKNMEIDVVQESIDSLKTKLEKDEIFAYIDKVGNKYVINSKTSENATFASSLCQKYLDNYKQILQTNYLNNNQIEPQDVINIIEVEVNQIEEDSFISKYLVSYTFLFIIMAITTASTYPATDATAGERERGTLETILTFPIKSKDIIIGKYLSVAITTMITGVLSLILANIALYSLPSMFDMYKDMNLGYSMPMILLSILIIICYSLFISGLTIAIASKSKSFKEAQSALTPLNFLSFFPGFIAYFAEIKSSVVLSMIPFLNYSLVFTDISKGIYDITTISLMFISTIVLISIVLYIIIKQYKSENVLFN